MNKNPRLLNKIT